MRKQRGKIAIAAAPALGAKARTKPVSVRSNGALENGVSGDASISANGRFVAFESEASNLVAGDTNNGRDVFVRNLRTGKTRWVSVRSNGAQGNGFSSHPSISADGRRVAFRSGASNLVAGDTNNTDDVFLRNLKTGKTRRVSVRSSGAQASGHSNEPSISADGRFVAFQSEASNLAGGDMNGVTDVFRRGPLPLGTGVV